MNGEREVWGYGECGGNWEGVLVQVSIAAKKHHSVLLEEERFIWLTLPDQSPSLEEVRTGIQAGLEAGADEGAMEGSWLLACSACFLIEPRPSVQGWHHAY